MGNAQISSCHWWERTEKHECSGLADLFDFHTHKIMYIFLQPAHTKACTKEVRIINGRSPWVSPGATKEGLQKRPQEPEEARADAGFLWFFVMGFSLLSEMEFFAVPKNGISLNI